MVLTTLPSAAAGSLLAVLEQAVDAFVEGYERPQHQAVRQDEAARREFIDVLLYGRSDLGRMAERAERFGLHLSQAYAEAVAGGPEPYGEGYLVARGIESALLSRFAVRQTLYGSVRAYSSVHFDCASPTAGQAQGNPELERPIRRPKQPPPPRRPTAPRANLRLGGPPCHLF